MRRKTQPKDSEQSTKTIKWIEKLSSHFGVELDEDQIEIFVHALKGCTVYQIDMAFDRCLNECKFMPKLAEVHQRMPEQRWPRENPGLFSLNGPPTLDLVGRIADELFPQHQELDPIADAKQIEHIFVIANRERYRRMGLDPDKWAEKSPLRYPALAK